jgi:hypothetical protein
MAIDRRRRERRPRSGPCRKGSRRAAEAVVEKFLGPLGHVTPTGTTGAEEGRRPGPRRRLGQVPTRLGQHSRNLIFGQALHQLPQLIALGAHGPESTAPHRLHRLGRRRTARRRPGHRARIHDRAPPTIAAMPHHENRPQNTRWVLRQTLVRREEFSGRCRRRYGRLLPRFGVVCRGQPERGGCRARRLSGR